MPRKSEAVKALEADIKTKETEIKPLRKRAKAGEKKIEKLKATLAKQAIKHKAEAEKIRNKAKEYHDKIDAMHSMKMMRLDAMYDHAKHLDLLSHAKERASKAKSAEDLESFKDEINQHAKKIEEAKQRIKDITKRKGKAESPKEEEKKEEKKEEKIEIVVPEVKEKEEKHKAQMVKGSKEAMEFGQRMKEAKEAKKAGKTKLEMMKEAKKPEADTSKEAKIPSDLSEFKKGLKAKHSKEAIENAFAQVKGKTLTEKKIKQNIDLLEKALKRDEKDSKEAPTKEEKELAKEAIPKTKLNIEAMKAVLDFVEHSEEGYESVESEKAEKKQILKPGSKEYEERLKALKERKAGKKQDLDQRVKEARMRSISKAGMSFSD